MRDGLSGVKNGFIADSISALQASRAFKGKRTVVYLHMAQPDLPSIRRAAAFCAKRGADLVLVSSGNPFPATVSGIVTAGLLSFSDTGESVRQLARCLTGAFEPAAGGSLLLGAGEER